MTQDTPKDELPNLQQAEQIKREKKIASQARYQEKNREKLRKDHAAYRVKNAEILRAKQAQYYAENRESILAKQAQYYAEHPERVQATNARWEAKNIDKVIAYDRAYALAWAKAHPEQVKVNKAAFYQRHREELLQKQRTYFLEHPEANEKRLERLRAYQEEHHEEFLAYYRQRRARKRNAPINDFTAAQWEEMVLFFKSCCAYCGRKTKKLTQDHVTPLSKGGSHTAANIVPACGKCNSRKHAGPVLSPVQPMLLLLAPAVPKKRRAS